MSRLNSPLTTLINLFILNINFNPGGLFLDSITGNNVLACLLLSIPVQGDTALLLCLCLLRSTACELFFNYLISVKYTLYYPHLLPIDYISYRDCFMLM